MVAVSWLIAIYYNVIIAHVMYFLFSSIASIFTVSSLQFSKRATSEDTQNDGLTHEIATVTACYFWLSITLHSF